MRKKTWHGTFNEHKFAVPFEFEPISWDALVKRVGEEKATKLLNDQVSIKLGKAFVPTAATYGNGGGSVADVQRLLEAEARIVTQDPLEVLGAIMDNETGKRGKRGPRTPEQTVVAFLKSIGVAPTPAAVKAQIEMAKRMAAELEAPSEEDEIEEDELEG